jgi:hypothetical protein
MWSIVIAALILLSHGWYGPAAQFQPPKSRWVLSMPLSVIATVTPLPVAWSTLRPGTSETSDPPLGPGEYDHTPVPSFATLRAWTSIVDVDMKLVMG